MLSIGPFWYFLLIFIPKRFFWLPSLSVDCTLTNVLVFVEYYTYIPSIFSNQTLDLPVIFHLKWEFLYDIYIHPWRFLYIHKNMYIYILYLIGLKALHTAPIVSMAFDVTSTLLATGKWSSVIPDLKSFPFF